MISIPFLTEGRLGPIISLLFLTIMILAILFVILPYKTISSYKKEGVTTYFFPVLGLMKILIDSVNNKGDEMAEFKGATKKIKSPKYLVTNLSRSTLFMLQDPKYIKEFLLSQASYQKAIFSDVLIPLFGHGLVSAEGETWKRHRKIISASFNFEFLKTNLPLIQNTTREFLNKLSPDDLKNYSAINKIQETTGEIVGRIFFGECLNNYTCEGKSLTSVLADITAELSMTNVDLLVIMFGAQVLKWPFIPKYKRLMKRVKNFRTICFDIIKDRKVSPSSNSNDLLSCLLATQKSNDAENMFSDKEIVDEFVTFFMAGMDTTGHLIGMTLYYLTQHPEYLVKLKAERDETYNCEKQLSPETLQKMDILHSVLKETLRVAPPATMTFIRRAIHDHNLIDLKVKKGDLITCALMTPMFDEKNFKDATEFNPGRWKNLENKLDPYAFTPFSAGPRNCIGQHLAIMEAKVIMSEFLERFEFQLKEGYKLRMMIKFLYEPVDEFILTLRPK